MTRFRPQDSAVSTRCAVHDPIPRSRVRRQPFDIEVFLVGSLLRARKIHVRASQSAEVGLENVTVGLTSRPHFLSAIFSLPACN